MDKELPIKWGKLVKQLESQFGKRPDLNAILLIIGMRELGKVQTKFSKEERVYLMHIAVCRVMSISGYYRLEGHDKDGWPHWELVEKMPNTDIFTQENLIRQHIIAYFDEEDIWLEN